MGVDGQCHTPVTLPPGKAWYPPYRRLGGPKGWSGQVLKISRPLGFDPRTVQPIVGVAILTELSQPTLSVGTLNLLVNVTVTILQ